MCLNTTNDDIIILVFNKKWYEVNHLTGVKKELEVTLDVTKKLKRFDFLFNYPEKETLILNIEAINDIWIDLQWLVLYCKQWKIQASIKKAIQNGFVPEVGQNGIKRLKQQKFPFELKMLDINKRLFFNPIASYNGSAQNKDGMITISDFELVEDIRLEKKLHND